MSVLKVKTKNALYKIEQPFYNINIDFFWRLIEMNKEELKKRIEEIVEKVEDEGVLKDMLNLINAVYKHYISGNWER